MNFYKEIFKLAHMLSEAKIPYTMEEAYDGWKITYSEGCENCAMDVVEHCGSYGSEKDLLEISWLLTKEERARDSVCGCLSAEDVFNRIEKHYGRMLKFMAVDD